MYGRSSGTDNPRGETIRVLLDGWPLVNDWSGPASIHIHELLNAGRQTGIEMRLAMPRKRDPVLPSEAIVRKTSMSGWGRLVWEQRVLPALARQEKVHLIHSVTGSLPLSNPVPCVHSPAGVPATNGSGMIDDIQASLGRGGYSRLRALLWPDGLPIPQAGFPLVTLPEHVHPAFTTSQITPYSWIPDQYIYCPFTLNDSASLEKLEEAWKWISTGLGEDWPLVVDGITPGLADRIRERSESSAPIVSVFNVEANSRAGLMQHAAVVMLVGKPTSWGDPLVQALACGRPIAAEENAWNALRAGSAAYLTPVGDMRLLGAAVITLAVEESMAEKLTAAALMRHQESQSELFPERLLQAYRDILG